MPSHRDRTPDREDLLLPCPECHGDGTRPSLIDAASTVVCRTCRGAGRVTQRVHDRYTARMAHREKIIGHQ